MIRNLWTRARSSELCQDVVALIAIAVIIVGFVAAAVSLGAAPAAAAPSEPSSSTSPDGDRTVEVRWAMPAGGTPDNVTWPQLHLTDPAAAQCGVWYQVDTYTPADAERFTRDGVLGSGEDHGHAIAWRFVYGGDCAPDPGPQPDPVVDVAVVGAPSCEEPTVTPVETTTTMEYSLPEDGTEWVLGEPVVTTRDLDPVSLSEDELAACRGDLPDPRVEYSEWSGGTPSCEDLEVEQTRTVTKTSSVPSADGTSWVDGEPVVVTKTRTVTYDGPTCEEPTEPTEPPTAPEPTEPPTSIEPTASSTSAERPQGESQSDARVLAETGAGETVRALAVTALLLLLVGIGALLQRMRSGREVPRHARRSQR